MLARQKCSHRTAQWEPDSFLVSGSMGCLRPPGKAGPHCVAHEFGSPSQTGTPCSLWKCSLAWGTSVPRGCAASCSMSVPIGHHCSMPPVFPAPCCRPLPGMPHAGRPPAPRPGVSRQTLALQRQLCHRSGFTPGCRAGTLPSVRPQEQQRSGWLLCSWETKGRSKRCQGCTAWHDAGCPAPAPGTPMCHQAPLYGTLGCRMVQP